MKYLSLIIALLAGMGLQASAPAATTAVAADPTVTTTHAQAPVPTTPIVAHDDLSALSQLPVYIPTQEPITYREVFYGSPWASGSPKQLVEALNEGRQVSGYLISKISKSAYSAIIKGTGNTNRSYEEQMFRLMIEATSIDSYESPYVNIPKSDRRIIALIEDGLQRRKERQAKINDAEQSLELIIPVRDLQHIVKSYLSPKDWCDSLPYTLPNPVLPRLDTVTFYYRYSERLPIDSLILMSQPSHAEDFVWNCKVFCRRMLKRIAQDRAYMALRDRLDNLDELHSKDK